MDRKRVRPLVSITLSRQRLLSIETSQLIWRANQWAGFYMIGTSVMKELMVLKSKILMFICLCLDCYGKI